MVDRDLVQRLLTLLDGYLQQLAESAALPLERYLQDWRVQRQVERLLQLSIEVCLDIGDHVVSDRRLPLPETAAETFTALGKASLIDVRLADALAKMARFRNLLVHGYGKLDQTRVYEAATLHVADIRAFRDQVLRLI